MGEMLKIGLRGQEAKKTEESLLPVQQLRRNVYKGFPDSCNWRDRHPINGTEMQRNISLCGIKVLYLGL